MVFRPEQAEPEFDSLKSTLANSRMQTTNNPLYQTILRLIEKCSQLKSVTVTQIDASKLSIKTLQLDIDILQKNKIQLEGQNTTDKAIVRWFGTNGRRVQDSTAILQDDGRISELTDPTDPQDAATKAYVDAGGGSITDYVVVSSGGEPGVPLTTGNGDFTYIPYNP